MTEPSFDTDLTALDEFHDKVYEGEYVSPEYVTEMHETWWRIARSPETPGNVGALVLLLYTSKYLPRTEVQPSVDNR